MTRPDRWERGAKRRNDRLAATYPLLAWGGLLPQQSAEQRRLAHEAQEARAEQRRAELDARFEVQVAAHRAEVAALLGEERAAALAAYRARTFPPSSEYGADFWSRMAKEAREGGDCTPWVWRPMGEEAFRRLLGRVVAEEARR